MAFFFLNSLRCMFSGSEDIKRILDRMSWVGRNLMDHLSSSKFKVPRHGLGHLQLEQVSNAPPKLALNTSRDGTSTTSLCSLHLCIITLRVKNSLLKSNLNLPYLSLKPFCLVLLLLNCVKSLFPFAYKVPSSDVIPL